MFFIRKKIDARLCEQIGENIKKDLLSSFERKGIAYGELLVDARTGRLKIRVSIKPGN